MIELVKRFFSKEAAGDPSGQTGDRTHDIHIATCALLLEMANIDGEFSDEERDKIISSLKKNYQLSEEYVAELIEESGRELGGSIDLWQFTNLINQNYDEGEKIRIIETVWRVSYADGILDKHEDYFVHKLANLLRLSHKQLIEAKLKVLQGGKS